MKIHPVADMFPMLPDAEMNELAADISKRGLMQPITVHKGVLLDGRNRLAACKMAGVEPDTVEFDGDNPTAFIVSANLRRRHMGESERAMVGAKIANLKLGDNQHKTGCVNLSTHNAPSVSQPEAAEMLNVSRSSVQAAQKLLREDPELAEQVSRGEKTIHAAQREIKKRAVVADLTSIRAVEAKTLAGVYDVIVLDPPWQMEKIERDCRPNQVAFDYPTMTESELSTLTIPAADSCHVWVWTTHKHLPMCLRLLAAWNMKYVCTFVWHKPGGFQPVGLPQFNCEFVVYARIGTPIFTDTKAFNVCFEAPRGKHSEKPEGFYDVVRRVTVGRRLDMFNRREIDGFDRWGQEAQS